MPKYRKPDDAPPAASTTGRHPNIRNISEMTPEPYDRGPAGIAGIARDIGETVGTRLIGIDVTEIPPGKKSSHLHTHSHKEEFFYVISGKCRIKIGDEEFDLSQGDAIARPAGTNVPHQFSNPYQESCSVMMMGVMAGKGMEDTVNWPELKRVLVIDENGNQRIIKDAVK